MGYPTTKDHRSRSQQLVCRCQSIQIQVSTLLSPDSCTQQWIGRTFGHFGSRTRRAESEELTKHQRAWACGGRSSYLPPELTTLNPISKRPMMLMQAHNAYKDQYSLGRSGCSPVWVCSRSNHLGQCGLYYVRRLGSTTRLQVFGNSI